MIVKLFSRGKGGGAGPVDYLLGKDRARDQAELLRGDPEEMIELIDASPYAKKYTAGVLSFQEADLPAKQKNEIMDSFEQTLLPGLDGDQYRILWIEHQDKGRLELKFVVANTELTTGKRLQPYYDRADRPRIDAWKTWVNAALDLHDPDDPGHRKFYTFPADLPKNKQEAGEKITAALTGLISQGQIKNRGHIVNVLEKHGYTIARQTRFSISIADPDGGRNIRLKGVIYEQSFRSDQLLTGEFETANREYKEGRRERARRFCERHQTLFERKQATNQKRYRRAQPPEPPAPANELETRSDNSDPHPGGSAGSGDVPGQADRDTMERNRETERYAPARESSDMGDRPGRHREQTIPRPAERPYTPDREGDLGRKASHPTAGAGGMTHDRTGKTLIKHLGDFAEKLGETSFSILEFFQGIANDAHRHKRRKRQYLGAYG